MSKRLAWSICMTQAVAEPGTFVFWCAASSAPCVCQGEGGDRQGPVVVVVVVGGIPAVLCIGPLAHADCQPASTPHPAWHVADSEALHGNQHEIQALLFMHDGFMVSTCCDVCDVTHDDDDDACVRACMRAHIMHACVHALAYANSDAAWETHVSAMQRCSSEGPTGGAAAEANPESSR